MTKDNATPRPWATVETSQGNILLLQGGSIKEGNHFSLQMTKANARLIVKAVNEYDGLIEMVVQLNRHIENEKKIKDELVEALKEVIKERDFYFVHPKAKEMINKALKKASE